MIETDSFYFGFTDNIKEPRKTKVENSLQKLFSYKGKIYNSVDFLRKKLLEGCYLEKQENYTYYKRNGEMSKPKTLYKFFDKDIRRYYELKKTEYDFVEYLINNGLDTEQTMEKAIADHKVYMEEQKRLQEENERAALEKAEQERKEIERVKTLLAEDMERLPEMETKIVDDIFLDVYGMEKKWNYNLLPLIHYYDIPYCKNQIKERLHNGNKASIKIFECVTGLKLPKGYKERMTYLESITSSDFKEPVEYKPRKKAEQKGKDIQEVYIAFHNKDHSEWRKVIAECFTKYGIDFFILRDNDEWKISVKRVGLLIAKGKTRLEAMENLKVNIDKMGNADQMIENARKTIEKSAGVNPLYKEVC